MSKLLRCLLTLTVFYAFPSLLLSGCNAPKNHLEKFNRSFAAGDFENACDFAKKKISQKDSPRGEDLLWSLHAGSVERLEQNYARSTELFDACESMIRHFDSEYSEVGHAVGAVAVNDNIVPYTGQVYDGVMVNTYKALNFMATGQYDLARVEFNRALDRQRRAKEAFAKEIQEQKKQIDADENSDQVRNSLDNADLQKRLEETYPSLYNFSPYPDFVNPFSTYLAGLFFLIEGDYAKSVDLLKESAGMMPENTTILEDLDIVDRALSDGTAVEPAVWVIFENGLGPVKEELRMDLPLFVAADDIKYVGIALPRLAFRPAAAPYLEVRSGSASVQTEPAADIDRVIQTEFEKDFKEILTRAVMSTTAKTIAQYALEKNDSGSFAAVAMALYSLATTAADVRIWTTLPKEIQVARMPMPQDRSLRLSAPGNEPISVKIDDCRHAIIYVRMISRNHQPIIETMTFN